MKNQINAQTNTSTRRRVPIVFDSPDLDELAAMLNELRAFELNQDAREKEKGGHDARPE